MAVLLPLLAALGPLASASPIDQTWLAGLFDDADYDDVIRILTTEFGASDGIYPTLDRAAVAAAKVASLKSFPGGGGSRVPHHLRAPPLD